MATMTYEKNLGEKHFYEGKTISFFDKRALKNSRRPTTSNRKTL